MRWCDSKDIDNYCQCILASCMHACIIITKCSDQQHEENEINYVRVCSTEIYKE